MKNLSYENLNMETPNATFLGTSQAMNSCSVWQEKPVGGFVECYTRSNDVTSLAEAKCFMVELTPGLNPHSGCEYPLIDPFKNTTAFNRDDHLYDDLLRYCSTSSEVEYFQKTFSVSNLQNDEMAVVYTAFTLEERGHTFHIIANSNELGLINFCNAQNWSYEIVGSPY